MKTLAAAGFCADEICLLILVPQGSSPGILLLIYVACTQPVLLVSFAQLQINRNLFDKN